MGLYFGRVPSVNQIETVFFCMDRAIVHAEMLKIRDRIGDSQFPVIDAIYHPNGYLGTKMKLIDVEYPAVMKIGSIDAGYGKFVVQHEQTYDDIESILCIHNDYFTYDWK